MFYRLTYPKLVPILALLILPLQVVSQSSFSGYYRFESGVLTNDDVNFLFNRNILQPEFRHQSSRFSLNLALQLRQNLNSDDIFSPEIRLREAYIDLRGAKFDLRLGQQMIVWGRADAAQIHDILTPMDLSEFLTQDFTDLRTGVTAINLTYYRDNNSYQFIVIPVFQPSRLADSGSRWSAWPTENVDYSNINEPSAKIGNTQFALRWNNRSNLNWDVDLSIYSGFNPNPALTKRVAAFLPEPSLQVIPKYKRNTAFMFGAEYRVNQNLILTTEQALWTSSYFDDLPESLRDPNQNTSIDFDAFSSAQVNEFLENSPFLQSMWGVRFPFITGNLSMQYILEYIFDHKGSMLQNQLHHTGSLLYTKTSDDERWTFRFLSRYHLEGNDAWINPDMTFAGIDGVRFSSGTHFFTGDQPEPFYGHLTFQNFSKNSFVYLKLTAYW